MEGGCIASIFLLKTTGVDFNDFWGVGFLIFLGGLVNIYGLVIWWRNKLWFGDTGFSNAVVYI